MPSEVSPSVAAHGIEGSSNYMVRLSQLLCAMYHAEVKLHDEATPISSLVQQYINNGATRCVKATGIDIITPMEDLYRLGIGPMNSRGQIPCRLERLVDDVTASGGSTRVPHIETWGVEPFQQSRTTALSPKVVTGTLKLS